MGSARARRRLNPAGLGWGGVFLHLLAGAPALAQTPALAQSPVSAQLPAFVRSMDGASRSSESACEQAGRQAERAHALPAGLLLAIGRVESGRWDLARGRVVPWPWAVDAGGDGTLLDSKAAAIARTAALRDAGIRNVDVGCYQVNLASHPTAFADLEQAFDPAANADYAGRFLVELHASLGNWDDAVAAYHSAQPGLGIPYRQLVYANWSSGDHPAADAVRASPLAGPLVVKLASGAVVQIWTPGGASAAGGSVTVASGVPGALPRVFSGTPGPR